MLLAEARADEKREKNRNKLKDGSQSLGVYKIRSVDVFCADDLLGFQIKHSILVAG